MQYMRSSPLRESLMDDSGYLSSQIASYWSRGTYLSLINICTDRYIDYFKFWRLLLKRITTQNSKLRKDVLTSHKF